MITNFRGKYNFLSNFYYAEVEYEGESYPSVEHAYQAAKTMDPKEREEIRLCGSPANAKRLGRRVTLRPDWHEIKLEVMATLLSQKFMRHPHLGKKLLETGKEIIREGNTWGDVFYGAVNEGGKWVGKNYLGKMLMELRGILDK